MSDQQQDIMAEGRRKFAVIVAGGKGLRMATKTPKQFLALAGRPVLYHTLKAFATSFSDMEIILVYPEKETDLAREVIQGIPGKDIILVKGGDSRFQSVKNGLEEIGFPAVVFVHDGVRPLVSTALIRQCYHEALAHGSAIPAVPLKESIRLLDDHGSVAVDREAYRLVQTPQTFLSEILLAAFRQPYQPAFTDEAAVVEKAGHPVHLIPGEQHNIKITTPGDLWLAEGILREREKTA